ncbi:MAG: ubiquitin-conjugating enzyme E2 [Pirellulaceae bacterium]
MRESPRLRRLRNDLKALEQLAADSSIFSFKSYGEPADFYVVRFQGRGLFKPDAGDPQLIDRHEVHIRLGASYPRMMPELAWKSPIFHPNISASGVVCLGGYGTYWVPSLTLDELCTMLWDMVRYENYDEKSPYNREAALWIKMQSRYRMPVDGRPLRDVVARKGAIAHAPLSPAASRRPPTFTPASPFGSIPALPELTPLESATLPVRARLDIPPALVPSPHLREEESGVTFLDSPREQAIPAELAEDDDGIVFIN